MRSDAKSRPNADFTPAAVWVEGHLGTACFLWMTYIEWVVKSAGAMTWRIWCVGGELRPWSGLCDGGVHLGLRARDRKSVKPKSSEIVLTSDSDAYFDSAIEPATFPLSAPCAARPGVGKPWANRAMLTRSV